MGTLPFHFLCCSPAVCSAFLAHRGIKFSSQTHAHCVSPLSDDACAIFHSRPTQTILLRQCVVSGFRRLTFACARSLRAAARPACSLAIRDSSGGYTFCSCCISSLGFRSFRCEWRGTFTARFLRFPRGTTAGFGTTFLLIFTGLLRHTRALCTERPASLRTLF